MNAEALTRALGGRWLGSYGTARCPAHDDHEPSLSIRAGVGGKPVFNCFAGCDWRDIKDVLRARGLLPERGNGRAAPAPRRRTPGAPKPQPVEVDVDQQQRMEFARRKCHEAAPLTDSLGDVYLRERGLKPGPDGWPPSLRYHASLKHGFTGLLQPALVAAVTIWPDRDVVGIQRTFLRADGKGKAPVTKPKMMIGRCGGGAVRLAPVGTELVLSWHPLAQGPQRQAWVGAAVDQDLLTARPLDEDGIALSHVQKGHAQLAIGQGEVDSPDKDHHGGESQ